MTLLHALAHVRRRRGGFSALWIEPMGDADAHRPDCQCGLIRFSALWIEPMGDANNARRTRAERVGFSALWIEPMGDASR